jgi:carbon-monoxide dehydrogenase catalytic subunit
MTEVKSIDPAAMAMLACAEDQGYESAFTRADEMKPCPIGETGACCKICGMGPCRLTGKNAGDKRGLCGADLGTIAARNFARMVAGGTSAHSDHGRDLARVLIGTAKGEAQGYKIKDEQKLLQVAGYMGIATAGREVADIALEVGQTALAQFGQPDGPIITTRRATTKRQALWDKFDVTPRAVDREVVEMMHRTHMGVDQDAKHILRQAVRCALADGWGGSMLATDISDILFGTPSPITSLINLGVLKEHEVNIVVHGHEPGLAAMMVEAVKDPDLIALAHEMGAEGISLAGICCTANEILMRYGIPPAGNFLHQELAIMTGAVETMMVDVQCVMQALAPLAKKFHTKVITTSRKAEIVGAEHIEFDEAHALDIAKRIVREAVENYPNRGPIYIPDFKTDVVAGFSHEYLNYMQGGWYRASFRPLNDAIIAGRIRGLAAVVGCNNARVTQDGGIVGIIKDLIAKDVLVVVTGCAAQGAGKAGYLSPEILEATGPGLREVVEAIGIPPVLHLGSCVDNSRILTVLTQVATEGGVGEDISDIPAAAFCPEWMSEKAISIGTYSAASGAYVIFGVNNPVSASDEVVDLLSSGWEADYGGKMEFEPDWNLALEKALAHIDAKRAALKLQPYDPSKFGESGDLFYARLAANTAANESDGDPVGYGLDLLHDHGNGFVHSHEHADGDGHSHTHAPSTEEA